MLIDISQTKTAGSGYAPSGSLDLNDEESLYQLAQMQGGIIADQANELKDPTTGILSTIGAGFKNSFKWFIDTISIPSNIVAGAISDKYTVGQAIDQHLQPSDVIMPKSGIVNPNETTMQKIGGFTVRLGIDVLLDPLTYVTFGLGGAAKNTTLRVMNNAATKAVVDTAKAEAVAKGLVGAAQEDFITQAIKEAGITDEAMGAIRTLNDEGQKLLNARLEMTKAGQDYTATKNAAIELVNQSGKANKGVPTLSIDEALDIVKKNKSEGYYADLIKATVDAPLDRDYAIKAMSNLLSNKPALMEDYLAKGGINFFGKTLLSSQRISSVLSHIPGMTVIDELTQPIRSHLNTMFNEKGLATSGLPFAPEMQAVKQKWTDFAIARKNEALRQIPQLFKDLNITRQEADFLTAAVEANLPPSDAKLLDLWNGIMGLDSKQVPQNIVQAIRSINGLNKRNLREAWAAGIRVSQREGYMSHLVKTELQESKNMFFGGSPNVSLKSSKQAQVARFVNLRNTDEKMIGIADTLHLTPIYVQDELVKIKDGLEAFAERASTNVASITKETVDLTEKIQEIYLKNLQDKFVEVVSRNMDNKHAMNLGAALSALKELAPKIDVKQMTELKAEAIRLAKIEEAKIFGIGVDDLTEIKKYDNVDDYIKAKTNSYHGGSDVSGGVDFEKSKYSKTFFVSDSKDYAKGYGGKDGVINDIHIKSDAKLIDIKNATPEEINIIRNKIKEIKESHVPYSGEGGFNPTFGNSVDELIDGARRGKSHFAEDPALIDVYKKLGYDGMVSYEDIGMRGKNIGIWNKDMVLTKSQLTDIWNKGNKKISSKSASEVMASLREAAKKFDQESGVMAEKINKSLLEYDPSELERLVVAKKGVEGFSEEMAAALDSMKQSYKQIQKDTMEQLIDKDELSRFMQSFSDHYIENPTGVKKMLDGILGRQSKVANILKELELFKEQSIAKAKEMESLGYAPGLYKNERGEIFRRERATIAEAKDAGFEFETNSLAVLLHSSLNTIKATAMKQMVDDFAKYAGKPASEAPDGWREVAVSGAREEQMNLSKFLTSKKGEPIVFHPEVAKQIENFSKTIINDEEVGQVLRAFDTLTNLFKASVTSIFLPFHGRNAISNVFQNYLDIGAASLNPVNHVMSARIIASGNKIDSLKSAVLKGDKEAAGKLAIEISKPVFTDRLGKTWYMGELHRVLKDYRVGFSDSFSGKIDTVTQSQKGMVHGITDSLFGAEEETLAKKALSKTENAVALPFRGGRRVGNLIEDQARILNFVANMAKTGDIQMAASRTKMFLFDYNNLTPFEKTFMRRLIPFYTWMRKNAELQVRALLTTPGRISHEVTFVKSLGDGELTDEEYNALPDYMKYQYNTVKKRDGTKVYILGSFSTPLEAVFSLTDPNQALATTNPFLRLPVELMTGYDTFRGGMIDGHNNAKLLRGAPQWVKDMAGYTAYSYQTKDGKWHQSEVALNPKTWHFMANIPLGSRLFNEIYKSNIREQDYLSGKISLTDIIRGTLTGVDVKEMDIEELNTQAKKKRVREYQQMLENAGIIYKFSGEAKSKTYKEGLQNTK